MREALIEALASASPERIAEAFDAAIQAAYVSTPRHGYAAALDVLSRHDEPEPAGESAEPGQATEPTEPTE